MKQVDLDARFDRHPPDVLKAQLLQLIRNIVKDTARVIDHECPDGREKSLALTRLEEAMHWAMASVERNESPNGKVVS